MLAEERREQIVRVCGEAIAERGYSATSVREIAARAGVSVGTLLHHFGSKDAILAAALQDAAKTWNRGEAEILSGPGTPTERLERLVVWLLTDPLCDRLWRVYMAFMHEAVFDEGLEASVLQANAEWDGALAACIREAIDAGELTGDDPELIGQSLTTLLEGVAIQVHGRLGRWDRERGIQHCMDFLESHRPPGRRRLRALPRGRAGAGGRLEQPRRRAHLRVLPRRLRELAGAAADRAGTGRVPRAPRALVPRLPRPPVDDRHALRGRRPRLPGDERHRLARPPPSSPPTRAPTASPASTARSTSSSSATARSGASAATGTSASSPARRRRCWAVRRDEREERRVALIYVEYITPKPGVALQDFHKIAGKQQAAWDQAFAEDELLLNLARTWRIGPLPPYLCIWHQPHTDLEQLDRWEHVFESGSVDDIEDPINLVIRIDHAGCYRPLLPPERGRRGAVLRGVLRGAGRGRRRRP